MTVESIFLVKNAKVCCSNYTELKRVRIQRGESVVFQLDQNAQIFEVGGIKTRAVIAELPALSLGEEVDLVNVTQEGVFASARLIINPYFQFLDGNFNDMGVIVDGVSEVWGDYPNYGYHKSIEVTDDLVDAKYVLVAASPSYVGKVDREEHHSYAAPVPGTVMVLPEDSVYEDKMYGYEGAFSIVLKK